MPNTGWREGAWREALQRVAWDGEESGAVVGEGGRDVVTEVEGMRVDIMKSHEKVSRRILDQRVGILLESTCVDRKQ
jgi:hypothetical protein